jgi:lysophospholipase L1-like esterase
MLQDRFGEGGHGYAIIANAWPGWFHIDVSRKASADWLVSTCVGPYAKDGLYGLGCASFSAHHKGVWSEIATATLDKWGRKVSSFEIVFLKQPDGGAFDVVVDGKTLETVETAADESAVAYHRVKVKDGAHSLKVVSDSDKPVRMFGIRMERDEPGLSLSAMGITGARARFLDKQDDAHFARVLQAAKPDLVALAFGSNEITDGLMYPVKDYRETLVAVMKQVEKAVPDASLMLVGPPDMASKNAAWGHSRPMANIIAKNQKELAAERGWAFWDQYQAMGGGGSMWSWIQAGLGSQDLFHPTGQGGNLLGRWQYLALMEAFESYKDEHR